jgi:alanine racemase
MPRPTQALIDLAAIRHNLAVVRRLVGPAPKLLIPVKADAYGHGAVPVARLCAQLGVDLLGIATVEEGLALREAGIGLPLILLGNILPTEAAAVVRHGLTASLSDADVAAALCRAARQAGQRVPVFVEVDTGMGRVGVHPCEQADRFITDIAGRPELLLQAVFSHFPCADEPDARFAHEQVRRLQAVRSRVEAAGVRVPLWSMANSSAVCDLPTAHLDLVRPGIMVYGYPPSPEARCGADLRPAMSLRSAIVFLKRVRRGTSLGYGRTYEVPVDQSLVATVPIGYADGYARALSNRAPVLIGGRRYRVSGRVSMDQITVDLGPDSQAQVGDEVVLFGQQGPSTVTVTEIAGLLDTIVYEVTCGVSRRVPRAWIHTDEP